MTLPRCARTLAMALLAPALASAQPPLDVAWTEITPMFTRVTDTRFGGVIAFDGSRVAIGSAGRVDVYTWDGTNAVFEATLDPGSEDHAGFGTYAIALQGDSLITAAADADMNRGAVYFYERNSSGAWVRYARDVPPPDGCCGGTGIMGAGTTITGTRAVMGAPYFGGGYGAFSLMRADASGHFSMNARSTFQIVPRGSLAAFDVAIDGDQFLVGNIGMRDSTGALQAGGAIFYRDTGSGIVEGITILNPTPADIDQFGMEVDLQGGHAYIGARYDDTMGTDAGALYVYSMDGGLEQTIFGTEALARFTASFDVDGDWMVVGSPAFQRPGLTEPPRVGSVSFLRRDASGTWQARGRVPMFGGETDSVFGSPVRISGNVAVVSAPNAQGGAVAHAGRVWVAVLREPNGGACDDDAQCTSGVCADGICCNDACDGTCESCRQSETGVADGMCASVMDGTDPGGSCGCGACMTGSCTCDAGVRPDAGTSVDGGGVTTDSGTASADAHVDPTSDGGHVATRPRIPIGCGCRTALSPAHGFGLVLLALLAIVSSRRSSSRTRAEPRLPRRRPC